MSNIEELTQIQNQLDALNDTDLVPNGWYGFAAPIGWAKIVYNLHLKLLEKYGDDYTVHQVKEKFGGLRYYFGAPQWFEDDETKQWVSEASQRAKVTCQVCGSSPAQLAERGWMATLCPDHAEPFLGGKPLWKLQEVVE